MAVLCTELKPESVHGNFQKQVTVAAEPLQRQGDFEAINTEATVAEPRPGILPGP